MIIHDDNNGSRNIALIITDYDDKKLICSFGMISKFQFLVLEA